MRLIYERFARHNEVTMKLRQEEFMEFILISLATVSNRNTSYAWELPRRCALSDNICNNDRVR
jgi:hypothetical protein